MAVLKNKTIRGNRVPARLIRYIMNAYKTSPVPGVEDSPERFVSAWGCAPIEDPAIESMQMTVDLFEPGRTSTRVIGYHYMQSFSPGETDPETAHMIGRQLISRLLGENPDFQIIQGTHLDKGHLHNHFFLMSLSNVDGHRLRSEYKGMVAFYKKAQEISDELCREHHLSVIGETIAHRDKDDDRNAHYADWANEKAQRAGDIPTPVRAKIRRDVDKIIEKNSPVSFEDLLIALAESGYELKHGKHVAIKRPGAERFVRLCSLGYGYSEEDLSNRLQDPELFAKISAFTKDDIWTLRRDIIVSPSARYPRYVRRPRLIRQQYILLMKMGLTYRDLPRGRPVPKAAVDEFRMMTQQYQYMQKNKINTIDALKAHVNDLVHDRTELLALQHRMYVDRSFSDEQRKEVNEKVRTSWKALRICERIGRSHDDLQEQIQDSLMER